MQAQLTAMLESGRIERDEYERIFYPTWNPTTDELLALFSRGADFGDRFEVLDHRFDASDDAETFPQYSRDGDATAFARAYVPFVRAITESPFFRSLDPVRDTASRAEVGETFYEGLGERIEDDPVAAACEWHVASLRIRRRPR